MYTLKNLLKFNVEFRFGFVEPGASYFPHDFEYPLEYHLYLGICTITLVNPRWTDYVAPRCRSGN